MINKNRVYTPQTTQRLENYQNRRIIIASVLFFLSALLFPVFAQENINCDKKGENCPYVKYNNGKIQNYYTGSTDNSSNESSGTNIFVDTSLGKTYVLQDKKDRNYYTYQIVARIEKGNGGDDDGHRVRGKLLLPGDATIEDISATYDGQAINLTHCGAIVEFCIEQMNDCDCPVIIKGSFRNNPCKTAPTLAFFIYPTYPSDTHPIDNYWSWKGSFKSSICVRDILWDKGEKEWEKIYVDRFPLQKWLDHIVSPSCAHMKPVRNLEIDAWRKNRNTTIEVSYKNSLGKTSVISSKNGYLTLPDDFVNHPSNTISIKKQ